MTHGSCPIKPDPRDKNFTALYGAPVLPSFPKTLNTPRKRIKNQGSVPSCTKQTTELAAEYQDGEEMSAEWAFEQITGGANVQGLEPRTAMGFNCKTGSMPAKDLGHSYGHYELYRKAAYIPIPKVGDWFDSIRAALLNGQHDKRVVMAFGQWFGEWDTKYIPSTYSNFSGWHAYTFIDFDTIDGKQYVIAQNSYGEEYGDHGRHYFSREVINKEFARFGTGLYVFKDLTPEQIANAKQLTPAGKIQKAIIELWWQFSRIFGAYGAAPSTAYPLYLQLRDLLLKLLAALQNAPTPPVLPVEPPQPPEVTPADLNRLRVYNEAVAAQGKDLSQIAPNKWGCAESLCRVLRNVYPNFPVIVSTRDLYAFLINSPDFKLTDTPTKGCVSVFPTSIKVGHCGIWGNTHVLSNTSADGKWTANYTHPQWIAAAKTRKLKLYHFIPL